MDAHHTPTRSYPSFPSVIPVHTASSLRVTHPSAMISSPRKESSHRLACVKHSVSVHPEPGSNSSFIYFSHSIFSFLDVLHSSSIFIVLRQHFPSTRNILSNHYSFVNLFFLLFCVFFFSKL